MSVCLMTCQKRACGRPSLQQVLFFGAWLSRPLYTHASVHYCCMQRLPERNCRASCEARRTYGVRHSSMRVCWASCNSHLRRYMKTHAKFMRGAWITLKALKTRVPPRLRLKSFPRRYITLKWSHESCVISYVLAKCAARNYLIFFSFSPKPSRCAVPRTQPPPPRRSRVRGHLRRSSSSS